MSIRIVRLGSPRAGGEGPRLGTVRRPPRGVKKTEYSKRDFFDVWLPELAPSAALFSWARGQPWTPDRWRQFARRYRKEMGEPAARHLLDTLAASVASVKFLDGLLLRGGSALPSQAAAGASRGSRSINHPVSARRSMAPSHIRLMIALPG